MKRHKLVIPENIFKGFAKDHGWILDYDGLEIEKVDFGDGDPIIWFDDNSVRVPSLWLIEIKKSLEVLTAEESWDQRCYPDQSEKVETAYISGFDEGDINGQRKQWDNHKNLRKKVREYINNNEVQFHKSGIHEALERIKPLEKDES